MEKKIGFIVYTPSPDKVAALHDQYGINAAQSAQEVAQVADIVNLLQPEQRLAGGLYRRRHNA